MGLGVAFLVLIALLVGLFVWSWYSAAACQLKFFTQVESGDPDRLMALFDPSLQEDADPPVLAAWMKEVHAKLGHYKRLNPWGFSTSTAFEDGKTRIETQGIVEFERGSASSELVFVDDKIVKFDVKSKQIGPGWFKGPIGTELYHNRGEQFLRHIINGDSDAAFPMMAPPLQETIPLDKLSKMTARARATWGTVQSIKLDSERFEHNEHGFILTVLYKVSCERASTTASVKFQFVGIKAYLVAFKLDSGPD